MDKYLNIMVILRDKTIELNTIAYEDSSNIRRRFLLTVNNHRESIEMNIDISKWYFIYISVFPSKDGKFKNLSVSPDDESRTDGVEFQIMDLDKLQDFIDEPAEPTAIAKNLNDNETNRKVIPYTYTKSTPKKKVIKTPPPTHKPKDTPEKPFVRFIKTKDGSKLLDDNQGGTGGGTRDKFI